MTEPIMVSIRNELGLCAHGGCPHPPTERTFQLTSAHALGQIVAVARYCDAHAAVLTRGLLGRSE
jgi:hypothetical protein